VTAPPYRILIVEDHATLREVYAELFAREPDLELCGTAESAERALEILDAVRCDVWWRTSRSRAWTASS
jgi:chemotaxis response regulator CheB